MQRLQRREEVGKHLEDTYFRAEEGFTRFETSFPDFTRIVPFTSTNERERFYEPQNDFNAEKVFENNKMETPSSPDRLSRNQKMLSSGVIISTSSGWRRPWSWSWTHFHRIWSVLGKWSVGLLFCCKLKCRCKGCCQGRMQDTAPSSLSEDSSTNLAYETENKFQSFLSSHLWFCNWPVFWVCWIALNLLLVGSLKNTSWSKVLEEVELTAQETRIIVPNTYWFAFIELADRSTAINSFLYQSQTDFPIFLPNLINIHLNETFRLEKRHFKYWARYEGIIQSIVVQTKDSSFIYFF